MLTRMVARRMHENPNMTAQAAFMEVQRIVDQVAKMDWKNVALTTPDSSDATAPAKM